MRKLQEGSPGKTVEHRGKHIEKNKDLKLNGVRPPLGFQEQDGLQGDEEWCRCRGRSFTHQLWHTIFHTIFHTPLCHTPSFTHNFVTHHLSHTTLSHRIFHTQLCHTGSFTHRHRPSLTYHLSHHFVTHHLSHTSQTIFHTPSFTHLLRNILSNYWCGMHRTCKNTSIKPDRSSWMTRSENPCGGNLSTSLLDVTVPSEPNRDLPLQISTSLQRKLQNCKMTTWRFLGWASSHDWKRLSRYVDWASPIHITVQQMRLRWMETSEAHSIPLLKFRLEAFAENQVENQTKIRTSGEPLLDFGKYPGRSFTSIQMFHTHTHTPRCRRAFKAPTNEMKVKMREMEMKWRWRWNDNYLTGTQEGERKKEKGRRKHQHQHT